MSQPESVPELSVPPTSPKLFTPSCSCTCPSFYRYGSMILASVFGFAVGVAVGRAIKK